jgi:hypothetical protein
MSSEAIAIAIEVAQGLGLQVQKPVSLRSTNNVVVWLSPTQVVAKVGLGRNACLRTELQVALELRARGAPIVSPAQEAPAVVHSRHGLEVTFWQYHAQPSSADIAGTRVASALRRLHTALGRISPDLRASLPSYLRELQLVRTLLTDPSGLPALSEADRRLLATVFDRLKVYLDELAPAGSHVVLHGSPHSYNVLLVDDEPVFIDFETACTGPMEWDLAHVDPEAEQSYGAPVHERLIWVCRSMASVKTAAFCWADVERGDLREHAELHLAHVRTAVAPYV